MDTSTIETGTLIKEYRKKRGFTQSELGEKIGVTASAIMRYELGQRGITLDTIQAIATALEVDPYSLMSFDMASNAIADRINARERVDAALGKLNDDGMEKAADAVEVIAEVPRYRATSAQEAGKAMPAVPEGKDTPAPEPHPESPENGG